MGAGLAFAFIVAIHVMQGGTINLAIFIGVGLVLMTTAGIASWIPARRASRIDPVAALRATD
jgi:ABC-type lipoprotein release transport system permease subunit